MKTANQADKNKNKGGGAMKRLMRRIHLDNKGFTMMELLIVVALIGVLVAVVVPNIARFIGRGEEEAAIAELRVIQTAMDAAMVELGIPFGMVIVVTPPGVSDFEADAARFFGNHTLYPNYLRTRMAGAQLRDGAIAEYSWDADGKVTSTAFDAAGVWQPLP